MQVNVLQTILEVNHTTSAYMHVWTHNTELHNNIIITRQHDRADI